MRRNCLRRWKPTSRSPKRNRVSWQDWKRRKRCRKSRFAKEPRNKHGKTPEDSWLKYRFYVIQPDGNSISIGLYWFSIGFFRYSAVGRLTDSFSNIKWQCLHTNFPNLSLYELRCKNQWSNYSLRLDCCPAACILIKSKTGGNVTYSSCIVFVKLF